MCSLPRPAKVSTVHSVVSMARSAAVEGGFGRGRRAVAVLHVGGDEAGGEPAQWHLTGREAELRAGVGRTRPAGRDLPDDAPADRLVEQLPDRGAGTVEQLERLVEVVREHEAGDGVHRARGIDLVDPRLDRLLSAARVDEPEHPACRPGEPRPQAQRARPVGKLVAERDGGRLHHGEVERPPERVEQTRLRDVHRARGEELGRPDRLRRDERAVGGARALEAVAGVDAQEPETDAVERGGHHVEVLDRARQCGQRLLDVVGHVADAAGRLLQRVLGG